MQETGSPDPLRLSRRCCRTPCDPGSGPWKRPLERWLVPPDLVASVRSAEGSGSGPAFARRLLDHWKSGLPSSRAIWRAFPPGAGDGGGQSSFRTGGGPGSHGSAGRGSAGLPDRRQFSPVQRRCHARPPHPHEPLRNPGCHGGELQGLAKVPRLAGWRRAWWPCSPPAKWRT